jgi:hypothetical protein
MAAIAKGDEIIKMVCRFMVTVKFTIRLNMMNVERLACFLCGYAAAQAM